MPKKSLITNKEKALIDYAVEAYFRELDIRELTELPKNPVKTEDKNTIIQENKVLEPMSRWREEGGIIYLTVTSDGTTGEEWIKRLEKKGFRLSDYAKSVLRSKDFTPAPAGTIHHIAILNGMLFEDRDRITDTIRTKAKELHFGTPNAEVACLIRENFSDEDIKAMGLNWIVAMHEPINDYGGDPGLLIAYRDRGARWLGAYSGEPGRAWSRGDGFAFVVSQVNP